MAVPTDTAETLVDRADRHMYASKNGGRNRITSDAGELSHTADRPILGTAVPWGMPELTDVDGFGFGASA